MDFLKEFGEVLSADESRELDSCPSWADKIYVAEGRKYEQQYNKGANQYYNGFGFNEAFV
ncbi:hypothetical protein C823_000853 [Eubacterium plexicaudatum ASF492]|jgi:hypothetical protein|uniref:Uncharacterized protein n=1 Tax=Eubacterium plexicaudatum ASF492 TaxID=1235802 RepID=N1ZWQ5_9FIRM|nr:hypothetical protein C823_000853 [Eubacterium plexicaudatum ASF492]